MPIVNVKHILNVADNNGYAVIGFNCFNLETIRWAIEAAEEEQSPVLCMLYPNQSRFVDYSTFAAITRDIADKVSVPVGIHLDHCTSFETIVHAMKAGFNSVMVDGSALPFEENVRITQEIVRVAHAMDVHVEAELGHVGSAKNLGDFADASKYTRPEDAAEFCRLTNCDLLAIAFGSAHGHYVATPKLDLELLERINKATATPLALHGGTGIPDEQIKAAVKLGISKINVGTGYGATIFDNTKRLLREPDCNLHVLTLLDTQKIIGKEFLRERIRLVKAGNV